MHHEVRESPTPMRRLMAAATSLMVCVTACQGSSDRATKQLAELQKKKEAEKRTKEEGALAPLTADLVTLDAPYDDRQSVVIVPDGPCPEGLWALFPGDAPGATPDEKKANAANRKSLAEGLAGKTFVVKLRAPTTVVLSPYDAPNGRFTIEVAGTIDCQDPLGRIAIAWNPAKAGEAGNSAAKEGAEFSQNVWTAGPTVFEWPVKSLTAAKEFNDKNRFGLSARVGFTLGKTEVDKKLRKVAKVKADAMGEKLSYGGGTEDWGAGRLVHAELLGIRVATDREKTELVTKTK